jgi:hypothetical protein
MKTRLFLLSSINKGKLFIKNLIALEKFKLRAVSLSVIAFLLIVNSSCSESDDEPSTNSCDTQIEQLADIMYDDSMAFSSNPTVANCQALRLSYLNLYNKMVQCDYPTDDIYEGYQYMQSLDCSTFDGSGGGGSGGGGGGGGTTGSLTVWSQVDHGCGNISVTVNGSTQIVSSYYSSGAPSCGSSGCANFTLNPGTYSISASCSSYTWNATLSVTAGGCSTLKLN